MSGLVKAKKYDWKDSNLALFGSDTERQVKKSSAETEKAWKGAGERVGIQIWRIVKFQVVAWPKEEYGKFYNGDSYIILNTYKKPDTDELLYDIHFWIGEYSSQDEYGTAAYKTVELDTLLDDKPIQHREVMGYESSLFQSYFKAITLLEGGAESGFKHVKPTEYKPRLLHFHGDKNGVTVKEKPLNKHSLDSSDVFILDLGLEIFQWNGKTCNKDEKFRAVQFLQTLKSERGGKPNVQSIDERDTPSSHKFYTTLSEDALEKENQEVEDFKPVLFRLSDETGKMEFSVVSEGSLPRSALDEKDVFIADTGKELFVWIGNGSSPDEKKNAITYAHKYLQGTKHPLIPVSCIKSGRESAAFIATVH
eukprot:Em0015g1263a